MSDSDPPSPSALRARAHEALTQQFGASTRSSIKAFAQGALSMLSDHTHYSNGFALLVPVPHGTAVALRPAAGPSSRVVFDGGEHVYTWKDDDALPEAPARVAVVVHVLHELAPGRAVDVAVASTIPAPCRDEALAALAVATARAAGGYTASLDAEAPATEAPATETPADGLEKHLPALRRILATCTALPFSIAFPIASAAADDTNTFTLVDTATYEHLPVQTAGRDALGWVLLDPQAAGRDAPFHRRRRDQADEAIALLRERAFETLNSFRELEHQNLPHAIDVLPPRLAPIVRYLVTDNRRVQKMVAALRRGDWQMVGALLLMSHASRRTDWDSTAPEADFIVDQVEALTVDGIYGACMTGRSGGLLLVGKPYALPLGLDTLAADFEQRFGRPLRTITL